MKFKRISAVFLCFSFILGSITTGFSAETAEISAETETAEEITLSDSALEAETADEMVSDDEDIDLLTLNDISLNDSESISIGDYIIMGNYLGEDILWRCVKFEKINDYDSNGNPITDSTTTSVKYKSGYLPLMVSDKIICIKPYDAAGTNVSGSHGRGYPKSKVYGAYRQSYGSDYWADSNIRDWLNSTDSAGNIVWKCGNPPDTDYLKDGYNWYDDEDGFLTNFTDTELLAIKTVTQKSLLDGYENNSLNSNYHECSLNIKTVVQNYSTAYSENVTDKMFLLDVQQVYNLYSQYSDYYKAYCTEAAVEDCDYSANNVSTTSYGSYWLRSPIGGIYN